MKIEFNKVTWYSKLATVVVFILLIPLFAYVWMQYESVEAISKEIESPYITAIKAQTTAPTESATGTDMSDFTPLPDVGGVIYSSNIIGYFDQGAVLFSLPKWISDHWGDTMSSDGSQVVFSPQDSQPNRAFSDISISIQPTDETYNAEHLYDMVVDNPPTDLVLSETLLNQSGDTRIYHTEISRNGKIYDSFYLDGNKKTVEINFDTTAATYADYGPKIREVVEGFGLGKQVQG